MSKETLLKELNERFSESKYYITLEAFFSHAISQTREETIREVEEVLPKEKETGFFDNDGYWLDDTENIGFDNCLEEIKQSLINLRK